MVHHHAQNPVDDAQLTQALVDVLGNLCTHRYSKLRGPLEKALHGSADSFVDTLTQHLLYEEEHLFPDLRRLGPTTAAEVKELQREHGQLRRLADDLARLIHGGETSQAYEVARTFLAELYGHIGREASVSDQAAG
jgi:hemerythrin-like domain-containing protein